MVSIKDIKRFIDSPRGIYHVVAGVKSGWSYTACGSLISAMPVKLNDRPKRVCKKCQEKLKSATLINNNETGAIGV